MPIAATSADPASVQIACKALGAEREPSGLAVVTGASSRIGREYVRRLASQAVDLIAVGRRPERLDELTAEFPDVMVQAVVADLATQNGIEQVIAAIAQQCPLLPRTTRIRLSRLVAMCEWRTRSTTGEVAATRPAITRSLCVDVAAAAVLLVVCHGMLYAAAAPRPGNVDIPEGWTCTRRFLRAVRA